MDKLGKLAYSNPEILYYYKNIVGTPPLQMVDDIMAIQRCSSKSLEVNKVINTFMDLEKLTLSKTKCHSIHIGNKKKQCLKLKVDDKNMEVSEEETYLGDVIDKSAKATKNIEKRKNRGYGTITDILTIVSDIPLAHWRIQAGLNLRQAMLINGTLFNSEAWHNVDDKDIIPLEKVDEALLRGLLSAHSKTPLEALYLETNSLPIRFILKSRRIMYLHSILQKNESEMVRKIYKVQKENPSPGDFSELVRRDCTAIELGMTDDDISKTSKLQFRALVKQKVRAAALNYLKTLQQTHSKMKYLTYNKLELQKYLTSPLFNTESRNLLLRLRTRTVSGIKCDFKGVYNSDTTCPVGCGDEDTLQHILACSVLRSHHHSSDISNTNIQFKHIFSADMNEQKQVTELYRQLLQVRNELISQPVAVTGPMHCSNTLQSLSSDLT